MMKKITLAHGGGGALMHELLKDLILKELRHPILDRLMDSATLKVDSRKIAFTTDSFVVTPIFFAGSDIGRLAVYGTVNDLAVCGAEPLYISCGLIIEEGLDVDILGKVARSLKKACLRAGVNIVAGDIKVVERGKCDRLYINTSGIGLIRRAPRLSIDNIKAGDKILINGSVGDHGISVLAAREGIALSGSIKSDAAPLNKLISKMLAVKGIRFMRDPTRGGVAATLNEMTGGKRFGILIEERRIFIRQDVRAAVELLGLDPLYIANEGKVLAVVSSESAEKVLDIMRNDPLGKNAGVIGRVTEAHKGRVALRTRVGGLRIVDMPAGELLPRIC